jgi:outer membrane protein OmpA-like peptidoglycan-associated protein
MTLLKRCACLIIVGLLFIGCTTVPTLSQTDVFETYGELSSFRKRLAEDEANGMLSLAPEGFGKAENKLNQAISLGRSKKDQDVAKAIREGREILDKAEADAMTTNSVMREVLEARRLAIAVGADSMMPEQFKVLENKFRLAAEQVEQGDLEAAKKWRPEMLEGYAEVELEALKQDATENARYDISQAIKSEADDYAPKTLKLAREELALAIAVLETNRTQRTKAKNHALEASKQARRSIELTELIKEFKNRDYSFEDILLWYQKQLQQINESTDDPLSFDRPNHEVVKVLQDKLAYYAELRQTELETRIDLQTRLAAVERQNQEAQARFDKIQDLFNAEEANVYRQGYNILLEMRAFNFPTGGSDIQAENFELLDKIVTAIQSFPSPDVVVSGHTDSVGGDENNRKLSQQRAETVASFLEKVGGVERTRLTAIGYGEARPVANNETEIGRKSNRRIEVLIINE